MAVWQYSITLFPASGLVNFMGKRPKVLDESISLEYNLWEGADSRTEFWIKNFLSFMSIRKRDYGIIFMGSESGNDVQLVEAGGHISEINTRIDLRDLNSGFLKRVLDIAQKYELLVITEDGRVLDPDINEVYSAICDSKQYRFVQEPGSLFE